jgi:hypothetical protein
MSAGGDLTPKENQAVLLAINKLASMASTGWLVARPEGKGAVIEAQGLVGLFSVALLGGAAAALEGNVAASDSSPQDETAVVNELKSVIFPAEVQFQAGCYIDQDGDGIGEFGHIDEMAGLRPTGKTPAGKLSLVPRELLDVKHGYRYIVYLPSSAGGAVEESVNTDEARPVDAAAAKAQMRRFVAYAWPTEQQAGGRVFAITQEGIVFAADHDGGMPAWNDLFDGKGWESKPAWPVWEDPATMPMLTEPKDGNEMP